jgi:hypothetical protein
MGLVCVCVCVSCETMHNSDSGVGAPAPKSVLQYRVQAGHMFWLGLHLYRSFGSW